jgi:hypothetical protein
MRTRVGLVPNSGCEIKKTKEKTQHMGNKNPTRFYCKE